jgi:hypothetical protein
MCLGERYLLNGLANNEYGQKYLSDTPFQGRRKAGTKREIHTGANKKKGLNRYFSFGRPIFDFNRNSPTI